MIARLTCRSISHFISTTVPATCVRCNRMTSYFCHEFGRFIVWQYWTCQSHIFQVFIRTIIGHRIPVIIYIVMKCSFQCTSLPMITIQFSVHFSSNDYNAVFSTLLFQWLQYSFQYTSLPMITIQFSVHFSSNDYNTVFSTLLFQWLQYSFQYTSLPMITIQFLCSCNVGNLFNTIYNIPFMQKKVLFPIFPNSYSFPLPASFSLEIRCYLKHRN